MLVESLFFCQIKAIIKAKHFYLKYEVTKKTNIASRGHLRSYRVKNLKSQPMLVESSFLCQMKAIITAIHFYLRYEVTKTTNIASSSHLRSYRVKT